MNKIYTLTKKLLAFVEQIDFLLLLLKKKQITHYRYYSFSLSKYS